MYRTCLPLSSIYCKLIECERDCGYFHEDFIEATTKLRCSSKATSSGISVMGSDDEFDMTKRRESQNVFESIIASAKRKISGGYREPPLPPLPEGIPSDAREKTLFTIGDTTYSDTTITKNHPYWKKEETRKSILGESDDEDEVSGLEVDPPSILDEDKESTIEALVKQASLDWSTNPIGHDTNDVQVFNDSDDEDYSQLDLTSKRRYSHDSLAELADRRYTFRKLPEYERSLDVS
ncbi:unnamed protein product, partial [Mesorhabditis belari]|uniref:Uncharacterized protein n=1 Tax=Mesorhabditis belari TaxID=2138241 RepID=A0AAF3FKE8_9BILA